MPLITIIILYPEDVWAVRRVLSSLDVMSHSAIDSNKLNMIIFKWLSNFLMILIVIYLYFMTVEWLTTVYVANPHEAKLSAALFTGEYAGIFWLSAFEKPSGLS